MLLHSKLVSLCAAWITWLSTDNYLQKEVTSAWLGERISFLGGSFMLTGDDKWFKFLLRKKNMFSSFLSTLWGWGSSLGLSISWQAFCSGVASTALKYIPFLKLWLQNGVNRNVRILGAHQFSQSMSSSLAIRHPTKTHYLHHQYYHHHHHHHEQQQ